MTTSSLADTTTSPGAWCAELNDGSFLRQPVRVALGEGLPHVTGTHDIPIQRAKEWLEVQGAVLNVGMYELG